MRYLASELGPNKIRVNAISAGPVKTASARAVKDFSSILEKSPARAPLRRNTDPAEVARASDIVFLCLPSSVEVEATVHGPNGFLAGCRTDMVLVDAFRIPHLFIAQRGVPKGDRKCSAIAAASIVAKVTRDRQMLVLHAADPRYGFDHHKGYATAEHLAAVSRHGYSDIHRRSFKPQSGLFDTIGEHS